jgi:hypothetical protein
MRLRRVLHLVPCVSRASIAQPEVAHVQVVRLEPSHRQRVRPLVRPVQQARTLRVQDYRVVLLVLLVSGLYISVVTRKKNDHQCMQ